MSKFLNILLPILFVMPYVPTVAAPKPVSQYLDNGELHSKITAIDSRIKHSTYFIIVAQTHLSVNTGSSAVINAYNDMRKISKNAPIYFVLNNNGGITAQDIDWYLKNVFRLPVNKDKNLYILESRKLFDVLHYGGPTSKMLYIYNTLLAYKQSAKYSFVTDASLPAHKFQLSAGSIVKLESDTVRMSYMDYFMPMSESEMLFLADIQNKVVVFDLNTGRISKQYDPGKSGVDYYCELIAKTNAECDTARANNKFLEELNRKNYYIFNMSLDREHVYLSAGIQVMVRIKEKLTFNNDEGAKDKYTIDTGKLYGYGFNAVAVLDRNLKLLNHYLIPEEILPNENQLLCTECAFLFKDDNTLISSITPDKAGDALMVLLKTNNNTLQFDKYLPPIASKHFIKTQDANMFNHICHFNGADHFVTDNDPGIYDVRYNEPVSVLTGDGTAPIKEKLPKYYEESEEYELNYQPYDMSTDGKLLYIIYKYKDNYLLEIKNEKYNTVDVININYLEGISKMPGGHAGEHVKLYRNKIYVRYLNEGRYYMSSYNINSMG